MGDGINCRLITCSSASTATASTTPITRNARTRSSVGRSPPNRRVIQKMGSVSTAHSAYSTSARVAKPDVTSGRKAARMAATAATRGSIRRPAAVSAARNAQKARIAKISPGVSRVMDPPAPPASCCLSVIS